MKNRRLDFSKKVDMRFISIFLIFVNVVFLFVISFTRSDFFYEHIENFRLDKISLVLMSFLLLLFFYGLLFFEKKDKLSIKEKILIYLIFGFLIITPPFLSRDTGAYLLGARNFVFFHVNPYLVGLDAVNENIWLKQLGQIWTLKYPFAYGPVFLAIISFSVLPNFANLIGAVYFYKIMVFIAYLLSVFIFHKIIKRMSIDPFLTILYAINPAILINGVAEGHNEIFVILFLLAAFYLLMRGENNKSFISWAASVFIKYNVLVLLPIFWKEGNQFSIRKILISVFSIGTIFALMVVIFFGSDASVLIGNFMIMKGQLSMCIYRCFPSTSVMDLLAGDFAGILRLLVFLAVYGLCFYKYLIRENNALKFSFWALLDLVFILSRWISPWYVLVAIPIGLLIDDDKYKIAVYFLTTYSLVHFFGIL